MPSEPASPTSSPDTGVMAWHSEPADAVAQALGSNPHTGLSPAEARARLLASAAGYARNAAIHSGILGSEVALLPKPFTVSALAANQTLKIDGAIGASGATLALVDQLIDGVVVDGVVYDLEQPRLHIGSLAVADRLDQQVAQRLALELQLADQPGPVDGAADVERSAAEVEIGLGIDRARDRCGAMANAVLRQRHPGPVSCAKARAPGIGRRLTSFIYEGVLLFGIVVPVALVYGVITNQRHALQGREGLGVVLTLALLSGAWTALFDGYKGESGNAAVDDLLNRGGMVSMLNTVWLIICAMSFGAVMDKVGLLERLIRSVLKMARSTGSLIVATLITAFGTNVLAADQYLAIVLPGRIYKSEYEKRGLAPENLSRALEDAGTITSPLIPWNTCGAYMAATLGVATLDYLPYAFFNLVNPVLAGILAYTGFKILKLELGGAVASRRVD